MSQRRTLPTDARLVEAFYNLLFPPVFLLLLPGYLIRMVRRGNFRFHFGQRFGCYGAELQARLSRHRWTWIQSISVGETLLALKLAKELRRQDPEIHLILSVTTTTGYALAEQNATEWLQPLYNPLDLRWFVRRVLRQVRVDRLVVIEGGIWPNLALACYRRGAELSLVNARLSPRSEKRFRRFQMLLRPLLRLFALLTAPEQADRKRWTGLGVAPERIQITGSIKFDEGAGEEDEPLREGFAGLLRGIGVPERTPILVAGSTFPGEERLLAETVLKLRTRFPELFLILVPRHVERTAGIFQELKSLPLRIALRSTLPDGLGKKADVLLVDTTGELRTWYALATVAFVGKSLNSVGGQNPAEPAILGKPVVFGPHMENFATVAEWLLQSGAADEVSSQDELLQTLQTLLADENERERRSRAGRTALESHRGAASRVASFVLAGEVRNPN